MLRRERPECLDVEAIAALVDGALEGAELARVEAHLARCEDCVTVVAEAANIALAIKPDDAVGEAKPRGEPRSEAAIASVRRFEMGELIGQGGMGVVYLGLDTQTGKRVAIKRLRREVAAQSPEVLARFTREAEILRRLDHPNIVKLLAIEHAAGQHDIVMEYVDGGSLRDLLRAQPRLSMERALPMVLEVADALSRAHHLQIVHRDIKPENVLLASDGTARLADFGLARMNDQALTTMGAVLGTVAYLSPEALWGRALDSRADVWGLGVTLFEMLAGCRPFQGDNHAAIVTASLHQSAPGLDAFRPDAPAQLVTLLHRMLEKERDQRISSARQIGAEIETILKGLEGTGGTAPSLAASIPAGPTETESKSISSGRAPRWAFSRDWRRLALPTLGLCTAAVVGLSWYRAAAPTPVSALPRALEPAPPPALFVDDFEDGDLNPRDRQFARWQRYVYNTSPERVAIFTDDPGTGSNFSLRLAWMVLDEANGKLDGVGAAVRAMARHDSVDLSRYSRLIVTQRYDSVAGFPSGWTSYRSVPISTNTEGEPQDVQRTAAEEQALAPEVAEAERKGRQDTERMLLGGIEGCEHRVPEASFGIYCREYDAEFAARFSLSESRKTIVVRFSELREPEWKPLTHTPLAQCLAVVDQISLFVHDSQLDDGQCHSGSIWVDDLAFR
jgi:predicted Ser/Thr protein kinase